MGRDFASVCSSINLCASRKASLISFTNIDVACKRITFFTVGLEVIRTVLIRFSDTAVPEPGSANPESLGPARRIFSSSNSDIPMLKKVPFDSA